MEQDETKLIFPVFFHFNKKISKSIGIFPSVLSPKDDDPEYCLVISSDGIIGSFNVNLLKILIKEKSLNTVVKDNKDKICKKFFEFISALSTDLSYCPNTEIIITTPHSVTEEMDSLRKKNSEFDEIQYLEYRENYSEEIDDMADELPFDCQFIDVVPPH